METRPLGRFRVSVVGLGCNNFGRRCDAEQSARVVQAALDAGVTLFDTADIYGGGLSEEYLGAALGRRRDDVVVATKFGGQMGDDPAHKGGSARWVAQAAEDSLRRLGTDRIDLYQYHFPDGEVPVAETLEALDRLVRDGKVLEIGCSNMQAAQLDEARSEAERLGSAPFVSVQNHYNLLHREPEPDVLDACERHGMGFLPYFPLASGLLTGKFRRGEPPPEGTRIGNMPEEHRRRVLDEASLARVEALEGMAGDRGRTLLDLAVSWLLSRPAVSSVIAGATRPEQVDANVAAAGWALTADDLAAVDKALAA